METIAKITKYSYERKLLYQERLLIAQLYDQGYSAKNISRVFECSDTTIIHHLKAAGVFEKKHKKISERVQSKVVSTKRDHYARTKLPEHIKTIYNKMWEEDEEMMYRVPIKPQDINKKHIPHLHILADDPRKFHNIPFIVK